MSEKFSGENPYATTNIESLSLNEELKEKILAAWGSARDELGSPNNERMAEILYTSIYQPTDFSETDIIDRDGFNRTESLTTPLHSGLDGAVIPTKEEFVITIRRAMTVETKFDECLYEGAEDTIKKLAEYGPIKIWTAGDVYGITDKTGVKHHGSKEQYKRISIAGFNAMRKEIAEEQGKTRHEVISVITSEHKMDQLPSILKEFKHNQIKRVIILEDRTANLEKAVSIASQEEVEAFPVWVRQGVAKNSLPKGSEQPLEHWIATYHAVNSIQDVVPMLEAEGALTHGQIGFIIDYDDVLSDDKKRKDAQVEAVTQALTNKGWLK